MVYNIYISNSGYSFVLYTWALKKTAMARKFKRMKMTNNLIK